MTGLVLAGGMSLRMGAPKATLRLGRETLLEHAIAALRPECDQIIVAIAPGQEVGNLPGCLVVYDEAPGLGPLAGLVAGLAASTDEWHLTLACDLPLVKRPVLQLLKRLSHDAEAVVPVVQGRLEPLLAAYASTCLGPAREVLATGRRSMAAMLDQVTVRRVEEDELRAADPELVSFTNVNTWEDYQALLAAQ